MHAMASCGKATRHFSQCSRISKGMAFLDGCRSRLGLHSAATDHLSSPKHERAAGRGQRPQLRFFDEAFAVARAIELEDGPAIGNAAVRTADLLGMCAARVSGTPHLRTMSALSHSASLKPDLMDGAIPNPGLAPMRAALQRALLYSSGGRMGDRIDEIPKHIIAERVMGLPADIRVDKEPAFKNVPAGRETQALTLRATGQGAGSTST
jgi:hypothetical protein